VIKTDNEKTPNGSGLDGALPAYINQAEVVPDTMNLNQIAKLVNRDQRTVRRWLEKGMTKHKSLADKLTDKTSRGKSIISIGFELEEFLAILKAGGMCILADLYSNVYQLSRNGVPVSNQQPSLEMVERSLENIQEKLELKLEQLVQKKAVKNFFITSRLPPPANGGERLRGLIFLLAKETGFDIEQSWELFYEEFERWFEIDLRGKAMRWGMGTIRVLERNGMLSLAIPFVKEMVITYRKLDALPRRYGK